MVALPGFLPLGMWDVGDVSAVGRDGSIFGYRQREGRGESTFDGNGEELIFEVNKITAPRIEENLLAVRSPSRNVLFGRMISEAARDSSGRRDDIDVAVAVVFASEGDERTIGGEVRERLDADSGSEPVGFAPIA